MHDKRVHEEMLKQVRTGEMIKIRNKHLLHEAGAKQQACKHTPICVQLHTHSRWTFEADGADDGAGLTGDRKACAVLCACLMCF
jgi:hypothetical protein